MSKPPVNTCSVTILEKEYNINCPESERDALMHSVNLLNKKINEVRGTGKVVGGERIAIMAALNLSHELLENPRSQEPEDSEICQRVQKVNDKIEAALAKNQQIELT